MQKVLVKVFPLYLILWHYQNTKKKTYVLNEVLKS